MMSKRPKDDPYLTKPVFPKEVYREIIFHYHHSTINHDFSKYLNKLCYCSKLFLHVVNEVKQLEHDIAKEKYEKYYSKLAAGQACSNCQKIPLKGWACDVIIISQVVILFKICYSCHRKGSCVSMLAEEGRILYFDSWHLFKLHTGKLFDFFDSPVLFNF